MLALTTGMYLTPARLATPLVARCRRITATAEVSTVETEVLRIDDIPLKTGNMYLIGVGQMNLDTSVDDTIGTARIRVATGGAATTASQQIGQFRNTIDSAASSNVIPIQVYYLAEADTVLSVLLTIQRVSGTGTVKIYASTNEILDTVVFDLGPAPVDTGVLL